MKMKAAIFVPTSKMWEAMAAYPVLGIDIVARESVHNLLPYRKPTTQFPRCTFASGAPRLPSFSRGSDLLLIDFYCAGGIGSGTLFSKAGTCRR